MHKNLSVVYLIYYDRRGQRHTISFPDAIRAINFIEKNKDEYYYRECTTFDINNQIEHFYQYDLILKRLYDDLPEDQKIAIRKEIK